MNTYTPTILVADQYDVTRAQVVSLLTSMPVRILQAVDALSAIHVIQDNRVDLVIFDHVMTPLDGFELARYIHGLHLPISCILMTADQTSDLLMFAQSLGIKHILSKPVDPTRLQSLVTQILTRAGHAPRPITTVSLSNAPLPRTPEELMQYAITLARKNVIGGFGGPYASVVADANGYILGEGVNLHSSRFDPTAHAEVMAIRKATETLQQPHLEGCVIYSTSEPTRIARALIDSVGISHIYFGLRHTEIQELRTGTTTALDHVLSHVQAPEIHHLCRDDVLAMWRDYAARV